MKIFKSNKSFVSWRKSQNNALVGFVPTMGALHAGHLSLIKQSIRTCEITIVSIFINPLQFGAHEDLNKYPQNITKDIKLLKQYKIDAVLIPAQNQMYDKNFSYTVTESKLSQTLEGNARPDFFNGVTTIVCKLFNLIQPQYVFFGLKDVQQLYIIKKMIHDLNYNIHLVACPTIREANGLAISSRNQYLTDIEKREAAIIYKTIKIGAKLIAEEQLKITIIKNKIKNKLVEHNMKVDYVSIADLYNFKEIKTYKKLHTVISVAVFYKNVRLIDNIII